MTATADQQPPDGLPAPAVPDDASMTLSEERLRVGTVTVASKRVRLRKVVVTEEVTRTELVSHEELRLEEITDEEAAAADVHDGPAADLELVLHAERLVVTREVVPVERVRVGVRTVTTQQEVSADLRREQVDLEQDGDR